MRGPSHESEALIPGSRPRNQDPLIPLQASHADPWHPTTGGQMYARAQVTATPQHTRHAHQHSHVPTPTQRIHARGLSDTNTLVAHIHAPPTCTTSKRMHRMQQVLLVVELVCYERGNCACTCGLCVCVPARAGVCGVARMCMWVHVKRSLLVCACVN